MHCVAFFLSLPLVKTSGLCSCPERGITEGPMYGIPRMFLQSNICSRVVVVAFCFIYVSANFVHIRVRKQ